MEKMMWTFYSPVLVQALARIKTIRIYMDFPTPYFGICLGRKKLSGLFLVGYYPTFGKEG